MGGADHQNQTQQSLDLEQAIEHFFTGSVIPHDKNNRIGVIYWRTRPDALFSAYRHIGSAAMSTEITLQLLSNVPKVTFNAKDIRIPDSSLDLFIYLAVENQASHDRDVLTRRLYETTAARGRLRQTALGNLTKDIKDRCIRQSPPHLVNYDGSRVTVDAHDFVRLAQAVDGSNGRTPGSQAYPQWIAAYRLYQNHFLEDYQPTLYGLVPWIEEQRRKLRELFHRLLEKLVQYEITEELYVEARIHAERWHQSLPDSELPLQYLIWLAANMGEHLDAIRHLKSLEELESTEPRVIGYSHGEWRRLLDRSILPDKTALNLRASARVDVAELLDRASRRLTGREKALEDVFEALFVDQEHRLLTITGDRGIGKSVLARAVAEACEQAGLLTRAILVSVTAETDLDQVLSAIALQLGKANWLELNYRSKYINIAAWFEKEPALLVIDQQEAGDVFQEDFIARIKQLSVQVPIIVCAPKAWDGVYDITLEPLESTAIFRLFESHAHQTLELMTNRDALKNITGGSPLALKLFVNTMCSVNLSLGDALAQVASLQNEARETLDMLRHGDILLWCWRLLDEPARRILASLMDFDLLEGPSLADLRHLHNDLPDSVVDDRVQQLADMSLVESKGPLYEGASLTWHSLVHEFLWQIDALAGATENPHFKSQTRTRFRDLHFNHLEHSINDYSRLAERQRNVIHAFEISLGQGHAAESLALINHFVPYLIRRGLYPVARRLSDGMLAQLQGNVNPGYIQLLLNMAKLDIKQGELQIAEKRLDNALALTDHHNDALLQGEIFQQLGIVAKMQNQIERSITCHERALSLAQHHEQSELQASILANLAVTRMEKGEYTLAREHLEASLDIAQSIEQLRIIEFTLTALSIVAVEFLEFEKSLDYLSRATIVASRIEYPERFAIIDLNLGETYYYLGKLQEARMHLSKSMEVAKKLGYDELEAHILYLLSQVEAAEGNLLEAERHCKQALFLAVDMDLQDLHVRLLLAMAKLFFQQHHWHQAENNYTIALDKLRLLPNRYRLAEALVGLGLSLAAHKWLIGEDDAGLAAELLRSALGEPYLESIAGFFLEWHHFCIAEHRFQHGLINFPHISRYKIPSAWAMVLNIDNAGTC